MNTKDAKGDVSPGRPKSKGKGKLILLVGICCSLLICCAVTVVGAYAGYVYLRDKDDAKVEEKKEDEVKKDCYGEGRSIPVVPDALDCCEGVEKINPQNQYQTGVSGICTNKCGDAICDPDLESNYNCPVDCQLGGGEPEDDPGYEFDASCYGEGEKVPAIIEDVTQIKSCCEGLDLRLTKDISLSPYLGICTAKCGNGVCDTETESNLNCREDCL